MAEYRQGLNTVIFPEEQEGVFEVMLEALFETIFGTKFKTRVETLLETMHVLRGHVYSLSLAMSPDSLSQASACLAWIPYGRQGLEGGNCAEGPSGGLVSCFELGLPAGFLLAGMVFADLTTL